MLAFAGVGPYQQEGTHLELFHADVIPLIHPRLDERLKLIQRSSDEFGVDASLELLARDKDAVVGVT